MVGLHKYLAEKNNIQVTALLKHQQKMALHLVPKEDEKYLTEVGTIDDVNDSHHTAATQKAKKLKDKYKRGYKKLMKEKWNKNPMHGNFPCYVKKECIVTE